MTTEKRIIDSAVRLFSQKGYKNTSIREVALKAGINKLTVFRHFNDKETLFAETIKVMKESQFDPCSLDAELTGQDIEYDLIVIGTAYLKEICANLPLIRIYIGDGLNLDSLKQERWFIVPILKEHFRGYINGLDLANPLAKEHSELLAEMFVAYITKKVMPSNKDKDFWERVPEQDESILTAMLPQFKYMAFMITGN